MERHRCLRAIAAACLCLALLSACTSTAGSPTLMSGIAKDESVAVWIGPVEGLHPHRAPASLTAALFSPLVVTAASHLPAWGPDVPGALVHTLASEDLRRWDITIKEGWSWHDGTPVVAEDLARGWTAAIDAGLPATSTITDLRVRDKTTISLALSGPYGQLPSLLADPAFLPLPPVAATDPARFASAPVGNGPFMLVGRDGRTLLLEAVRGHPAGDIATGRVRVALDEEPAPAHDVVLRPDGQLPPDDPARPQVVTAPGRQLAYVGLPLIDPRYAEADVRAALSMAIDRDALVADLLGGAAVPADRLVGPGLARIEDVTCAACRFDPDAAAELWPDDFAGPLTIWFSVDGGHEPVVEALAASWRQALGVEDIQLASLPAGDLLERLTTGEVSGPFRLTWAADVPSPSRVIEPLLGPHGSANDVRYRSADIRDLLVEADLARDLQDALGAYGAAEQVALDDLPLIPLWFSVVSVAAAEDVVVALDGAGRLDWRVLERR